MTSTQAAQLEALYNKIDHLNTLKEQTISQTITMTATQNGDYIFTFDELTELIGIKQITEILVSGLNSSYGYGYETLVPIGMQQYYHHGNLFKISGNTLTVTMYNGVNTTSVAEWVITGVGI